MPKVYSIFNLAANIYFGLRIPVYNKRDVLAQKYTPLYKIPYYYFSTIVNINPLSIFIFFLTLYLKSDYKYSTYLSKEDKRL